MQGGERAIQTDQEHLRASAYLARWANEQDGWIRRACAIVLSEYRSLNADEIKQLVEVLLAEKGLSDEAIPPTPALTVVSRPPDGGPTLRLLSLSDTKGVNRLVESQTIEFNDRLTIVYGENAAGKTGYARILKSAANSRSAGTVLSDVYRADAAKPSARIRFALGDDEYEETWSGSPLDHLDRICVFDAPAAPMHVDEDLSYLYSPADVVLFEHVHTAIRSVREELEAMRRNRDPGASPFLSRFRRGTAAYAALDGLRATSDREAIAAAAQLPDEAELEAARDHYRLLNSDTTSGGGVGFSARRVAAQQGISLIDTLLALDGPRRGELLDEETQLLTRIEVLTSKLFADNLSPGHGTPEWEALLRAAHDYTGVHEPHETDDPGHCPYCRQELGAAARDLLQRYRQHLTDQSQSELQTIRAELEVMEAPIRAASAPMSPYAESDPSPAADAVRSLGQVVVDQQRQVNEKIQWSLDVESVGQYRSALAAEVETCTISEAALTKSGEERDAALATARARVHELEDGATLAAILPDVLDWVDRARWADHAKAVLGGFQATLRGLTETANAATRNMLTKDFEDKFYDECALLRCPPVRLEFPGRQGGTLRHKSVGVGKRLGEVLSEGEQKVIAMADFLAETHLRGSSGPIVLDDPITSLDARRNDDVANRIVRLSEVNQVVVFTHHLYFASKLLAAFEDRDLRSQCSFYEVLAEDNRVGLIHRGEHPRMDTVAAIAKRVESSLREATEASGSARDGAIATAYGHMRTWIEAFVEDRLLEGAVKRHRANISVDALGRVDPARLDTALGVLQPVFDRACRRMWPHSQPADALQSRPELSEAQSDWETLRSIQ